MSYRAQVLSNVVAAGELAYVFESTTRDVPARNYGVLLLHGWGANDQYLGHTRWGSTQLAPALARNGFHSIAGTMGGDAFGNATAMSRVDAHRDLIGTYFPGTDESKVHLIGGSMGGYTALRYAINNPTKVASITGIIPLCDIVGLYNTNAAGLRASVQTAWGVVYPAALPAGADLLPIASTIADFDIPTRLYYDDADAVIPAASVQNMAALTGGAAVEVAADLGHTENEIFEISKLGAQPWQELIDFLIDND